MNWLKDQHFSHVRFEIIFFFCSTCNSEDKEPLILNLVTKILFTICCCSLCCGTNRAAPCDLLNVPMEREMLKTAKNNLQFISSNDVSDRVNWQGVRDERETRRGELPMLQSEFLLHQHAFYGRMRNLNWPGEDIWRVA